MKVLVISQYWAPEQGVPQRRWAWLTQELHKIGASVTVIAPQPHYLGVPQGRTRQGVGARSYMRTGEVEYGAGGEKIIRTGYLPSGDSLTSRVLNQLSVSFGQALALIQLALRGDLSKFNLVIGTVPALPTAVVARIGARLARSRFVVDLRDAWPDLLDYSSHWNDGVGAKSVRERVLSLGPRQILTHLTGRLLKTSLAKASGIIVTSEKLQHKLEKEYRKPSGTIVTIRNVFPVQVEEVMRHSDEKRPGTLRVLYAGTIGRAQNLLNALKAVELLVSNGVDVEMRIVGAGAGRKAVEAAAHGIRNNVVLLDRVGPDKLRELYQWADTALVHLTDWAPLRMAVPSKLYELLELGIHVSVVAAGETADIVDRLNSGFVVPPENPRALAAEWEKVAVQEELTNTPMIAREWVRREREDVVPARLLDFFKTVSR